MRLLLVTKRNFQTLAHCVQGRAKVLLTCRTHYFKSRTEEEEVVLGNKQDYGSETARELYWELISRKGFKIAYLRPFTISQVEEYVRRAKPKKAKQALNKIRSTYNLMELSQRPMLLEMIVKSIDTLNATEINAATLYEIYTDAWIHRDQWRDVLSPEDKVAFLMALARSLWHDDVLSIHYTRLFEYLNQELASEILNAHQLIEIDNEIRTASFLTRDDSGHYGFAHKSFMEFFFARYLATQLKAGNLDCFHTRRISPEIVNFLKDMIDTEEVESLLEGILSAEYRINISENALLCLYGFRRFNLISGQGYSDTGSDALTIQLPHKINLKGAQLDQVTLEGAVLTGADLTEANLTEAVLVRVDLSDSTLSACNLVKADLRNANLRSASALDAKFTGANLDGVDLCNANFRGANFQDAYLLGTAWEGASFDDVILSGAVLPNDLKVPSTLETDFGRLRQRLLSGNTSISNELWEIIEQLRPEMLRAARLVSLTNEYGVEDIISDIALRLVQHYGLNALKKLDEKERISYIYWCAQDIARRRQTIDTPLIQEETYEEADVRDSKPINIGGHVGFKDISDYLDFSESPDDGYDESNFSQADLRGYTYPPAIDEPSLFEKVLVSEMKKSLPVQMWRIIEARYVFEYDLEEIAQMEGLSKFAVQRFIIKGKEVLRKRFK